MTSSRSSTSEANSDNSVWHEPKAVSCATRSFLRTAYLFLSLELIVVYFRISAKADTTGTLFSQPPRDEATHRRLHIITFPAVFRIETHMELHILSILLLLYFRPLIFSIEWKLGCWRI